MARSKKKTSTPKVKQLVRIRFKQLANGEQSIYLDIYKEGKRAYEFLKGDDGKSLRILPETGTPDEVKAIKARNHKILLQAEAIRVAKEKEVVELGKVEKQVTDLGKMLLKDWLNHYKTILQNNTSESNAARISTVAFHLNNWLGSKFETQQMQQIDEDWCRDFLQHLKSYTWKGIKEHPDKVYKLSEMSLYHFFVTLRYCFGRAVADGVMQRNPTEKMRVNGELPKRPKVQKTFLTKSEVVLLMKTDITRMLVKRAFLFGCFTGLRFSDIEKLEWQDIKKDGENYRLHVTMKKTKTPLYMKLNSQALAWLPEKGESAPTDRVFEGLPTLTAIERHLQNWGKKALVEKHFTFHTSRHTFATLMLNNGVDIFTVSKLMGHSNLATTQVYLELLNKTRDDAVDRLSEIFKGVEGV